MKEFSVNKNPLYVLVDAWSTVYVSLTVLITLLMQCDMTALFNIVMKIKINKVNV